MGKKKIALFMATVMALTSVCPAGAALAEDSLDRETSVEAVAAVADETPGEEPWLANDVADADSAKEQVTAPEEGSADASAGLPTDDTEADLIEEDVTSDDDVKTDPENAAEGTDGNLEKLTDTIGADGEQLIEITDIAQISAEQKTISSVEVELQNGGFYDVCRSNYTLRYVGATITYSDGSVESVDRDSWYLHEYQESGVFALNKKTGNGDMLCLTCWSKSEAGEEKMVDWPIGEDMTDAYSELIRPGKYTIKLEINGALQDGKEWDIEVGFKGGYTEIEKGGSDRYDLGTSECKWYKLEISSSDRSERYVIQTQDDPGFDDISTHMVIGTYQNGVFTLMSEYGSQCTLDVEPGTTYMIEVFTMTSDETTDHVTGTFSVTLRRSMAGASVSLDVKEDESFDIFEADKRLRNLQAEISYSGGGNETISTWSWDHWYDQSEFENEEIAIGHTALRARTKNADDAYLTMWKTVEGKEKLVDMPLFGSGATGSYTLKLFIKDVFNSADTFPRASASIKITLPTGEPQLKADDSAEYGIDASAHQWYSFTAEESGDYTVKLLENTGGMSPNLFVYTKESYADGSVHLEWIADNSDSEEDSEEVSEEVSFQAEGGTEYLLVLENTDGSGITGKICITKKDHVHNYSVWVVTKEATCTEAGRKECRCSCGDVGGYGPVPALGHNWGAWKTVSAATVLAPAKQQRECSRCHEKETKNVGSPLPATITVPAVKANMKTGQSTSAFNVGMGAGDSIVSVTSSNTKLMKVTSINKTGGTFKLKAGKKTGKVKITIKLASGQTKVITLTVQKKKVTTKKVKVTKKLTLKKGAKYTLKPVVTPITTQDKIKFKSSNKKIAAVTSKGVVTAKKPGTVTITVTCGKKKAKCKITVKK